MTKRIFAGILAGILLLMLIAPAVSAAETSGTWGNHTWSYDNFTLTISGEGDMEPGQPWAEHKNTIEHLVFTGGVTKIAEGAFEDYDAIETIDFGDDLREIGKRAFYDCSDITELRLPETFRIFGEQSFAGCDLLSRIICEGGIMPSFKSGCMHTSSMISVFYPPNNPWAWEYTNQVMSAYGGRVAFYMASEEIMAQGFPETEPTEAEEEEAAEETVPETEAAVVVAAEDVVPETTAATVPVTEPVTEPVTVPTEAATEPAAPTAAAVVETQPVQTEAVETVAAEETMLSEPLDLFREETEPAPTEEPEKRPVLSSSSLMGVVMIAGVLTFLLAGAMIYRNSKRNRF